MGIEVIAPDRAWPLEDILAKYQVSEEQARELRASYRKPPPGGGHDAIVFGLVVAMGAAAVAAARAIIRVLPRAPIR